MTKMFPYFVCCKTAEVSFDCVDDGIRCWHTMSFSKSKVVTQTMREMGIATADMFKRTHEKVSR